MASIRLESGYLNVLQGQPNRPEASGHRLVIS